MADYGKASLIQEYMSLVGESRKLRWCDEAETRSCLARSFLGGPEEKSLPDAWCSTSFLPSVRTFTIGLSKFRWQNPRGMDEAATARVFVNLVLSPSRSFAHQLN